MNSGERDEEAAVEQRADDAADLAHDEWVDQQRELGHVAEVEELKASLRHVRGQRDALLLACSATKFFHSVGGLVTLDDLAKWSALTDGAEFTATGLHSFVVAQMRKAGCS